MKRLIKVIIKPKVALRLVQNKFHAFLEHCWAKKDSKTVGGNEKVLFVDLGANIGQGYTWFKQYFSQSNVSFELFEPNPFCYEELLKLPDVISGKVLVHNVGVGVKAGSFKFFGLSECEGGKYSQGGSFVKEHNSNWYKSSNDAALDAEVISFVEYLIEKSDLFDRMIVKMDIEGAEIDLLEGLIASNSVKYIDTLYVEFHSQYQEGRQSLLTKRREKVILKKLAEYSNLKVRIWH